MKTKQCLIMLITCLISITSCQAKPIMPDNIILEEPTCVLTTNAANYSSNEGLTWVGITVGKSTKQDVIDYFGEPTDVLNKLGGHLLQDVCLMKYEKVYFWVSGEQVIAIEFSLVGDHIFAGGITHIRDLQTLIENYGIPEFVGWGHASNSGRYLVWPEQGLMAYVYAGTHLVSWVVYFSPMNSEKFPTSPFQQFVRSEKPPEFDAIVVYPNSDLQNPFDWSDFEQ